MAVRSGMLSPSPTQPAQNLIPTHFDGFQGTIDKVGIRASAIASIKHTTLKIFDEI
jgi:hypothetical protein